MKNSTDFTDVSSAIANTLKEYRKREKLSLDTLSKQASVSKGMLVDIERGTANPSVGLLCKLSKVIGIPVSDFVNVCEKNTIKLINNSNFECMNNSGRNVNELLLGKVEDKSALELWSVNILPGESYQPKKKLNSTTVILHVMSGTIEIKNKNNLIEVMEGYSIVISNEFIINNNSNMKAAKIYVALTEL